MGRVVGFVGEQDAALFAPASEMPDSLGEIYQTAGAYAAAYLEENGRYVGGIALIVLDDERRVVLPFETAIGVHEPKRS